MTPFTSEQLRELAALPYGEARKRIRKIDPLWGLEEGEEITWRVSATQDVPMVGRATVRAASVEAAEAKAHALSYHEFDWEPDGPTDDFSIDSIEPVRPR